MRINRLRCLATFLVVSFMTSFVSADEPATQVKNEKKSKVIKLFDGKSLKNWKITNFGGEGDVRVEDGLLIIDMGEPLTGISWTGEKLPTVNYELSFQAQRMDGNDFFAALTFPVKETPCSLILGGWGGSLIGLSNINDFDASENDTTDYFSFENKKWYKIRLRVDDKLIQAWIDDERIIKVDHTENRISIRIEMELSKPLGLASFQSTGAIKDFKLTKLASNAAKKQNDKEADSK